VTERTSFTPESAKRIANAVRAVEQRPSEGTPLSFSRADSASKTKTFRVCAFTGSWQIGTEKAVVFLNQTTTPNTVSAINLFCGLNPGTAQCEVSVAKEGTSWYLVQPNLTDQPGYSSQEKKFLSFENQRLGWSDAGGSIVLAKFTGSSAWVRMTVRQCLLFPENTSSASSNYLGTFSGQTVTAVSLMFSMPGFTGATTLANYTTLGRYVMLSKLNGVYQVVAGEGN
jgi:hypothetical protein